MRSVFAASVTMIFLAVGSSPLAAQQGAAALSGTVLDASRKGVPGAAVAIRNDAGGVARTTSSDSEGLFSVANLTAGTYTVEASAAGFSATTRSGVRLASGMSENISITLNVSSLSQSVTVEDSAFSMVAQAAPSMSSLEATTAESIIGSRFIQNFMSPVGDFADVIQMSPGTFSVSPNGPGLGDTKTFFRGFKDGFYNMTFDGIPFNDTNDPTHHSWVLFPNPFIGSTVFDRSPGDATSVGPSNSGGSINLLSRELSPDQDIRGTVSYGSFNTRLLELDYDSGPFGGRPANPVFCWMFIG